jgi:2-oxoglutarate dehydrogenase E2 component (dihydrolipoamide succinyltransferase)
MIVEIKVPSVGESVTEALLAQWFKSDGDRVKKDEPLFVIETDKITLEVVSEADGVLSIKVKEGETVAIGAVVGTIDAAAAPKPAQAPHAEKPSEIKRAELPAPAPAQRPTPEPAPPEPPAMEPVSSRPPAAPDRPPIRAADLAPSVRRLIAANKLEPSQIAGTGPGGRITKGDVVLFLESSRAPAASPGPAPSADTVEKSQPPAAAEKMQPGDEFISRKPMSPMRRRIAAHLLSAKQNTAMLTTFNDIDMTRLQAIRAQFKESFKEKYGVSLGMMSFFIKASVEALKELPQVNAFIDANDIVYHHYYHIGVAIGSEKALVVPVIRHADQLGFAELEQAIVDFVNKIKENRLELSDLEGGTFTISNGGVFGSLLSTPILNMPQSAILGMHRIEKRPVALEDQIVIRPMMYVALSYDHRIIDGREAVTFLKRIKECIENPERMMMEI